MKNGKIGLYVIIGFVLAGIAFADSHSPTCLEEETTYYARSWGSQYDVGTDLEEARLRAGDSAVLSHRTKCIKYES